MNLNYGSSNLNKGSASMTMVITAAAISGVIALGVTRIMSMQFSAVASTDDKLRAQHDALNRAEVIRAGTFASLESSSKELPDGFFEDVDVKLENENGVVVKVATVNIYKDKSKSELVASMVVKRTNPSITLADEYKPEGAKDAAYNVSVVNKYFAHVDRDKNNGSVGNEFKPVYVKDGTVSETDFSKAVSSDSDKIAVINPDGSFGYTTKNEFIKSNGISRTTIGYIDVITGLVTYDKGAPIEEKEPYVGQILILRPNWENRYKTINFSMKKTFTNIVLQNSAGQKGRAHSIKPSFGMNYESLFAGTQYKVTETKTYSPWVLIYDGNDWLMIGTYLNGSGYAYSG
mgnify:CR=1 FL=1